jgi:hypothetical protein
VTAVINLVAVAKYGPGPRTSSHTEMPTPLTHVCTPVHILLAAIVVLSAPAVWLHLVL